MLRAAPRGLAAVEFGLAAPILILLLVGLVDFGLGFYASLQVQGAASAGAEYASVHGMDTVGITSAVQQNTILNRSITMSAGSPSEVCGCTNTGTMVEEGTFNGSCSGYTTCTGGGGAYAKVQVQYSYSPMLPYPWVRVPVTLSGLAYRRLQ
ncbi:MAG TPA: TadE/TadG family type IV pilus assembly protein [Stellaceae bacterium]|nr:TadE/TadG family type IV pilus assembly protein [Stellaceae bacterium]